MVDLLLIFLAQFFMIAGLGIQQLNVQGGHKLLAAGTSLLLGVSGFHITATIAQVGEKGLLTPEGATYLIAGPLGIITAMKYQPKLRKLINGK